MTFLQLMFLTATTALLSSCAKVEESSSIPAAATGVEVVASNLATQPTSQPQIEMVLMHRSGCFGTCPVYDLEISSNGQVKFVGDKFVAAKGFHTKQIPPEQFSTITDQLARIDFFALRDQYRFEGDGCKNYKTDQPTVDFVVTTVSVKKHVSYYYGCLDLPVGQHLESLSDLIDKVAESDNWVGREPSAL